MPPPGSSADPDSQWAANAAEWDGLKCLVVGDALARMADVMAELHEARLEVAVERVPMSALLVAMDWRPHVLIGEATYSDGPGAALVRAVRTRSQLPILVVAEGADASTRIELIEAGVDDILPLPISGRELLVRIRAGFARVERARALLSGRSGRLRIGPIELDADRRDVLVSRRRVHMTPTELGVLRHLMVHEGEVLARSALLDAVWGIGTMPESNVVDRQIRAIRRKLGVEAARYIETVSGIGYRMRSDRIVDTLWSEHPLEA